MKTSKLQEKPCPALKREPQQLSSFLSYFVGEFCPPGSGFLVRVRIQLTKISANHADHDPDPQHWGGFNFSKMSPSYTSPNGGEGWGVRGLIQ